MLGTLAAHISKTTPLPNFYTRLYDTLKLIPEEKKKSTKKEFREQINFLSKEMGHCFLCGQDVVVVHIRRHFQRQHGTKVAQESPPTGN